MCKLDFSIQKWFSIKPKLFFISCFALFFIFSANAQFLPGQLPVNLKTFIAAAVNGNKVNVFWTTLYEKSNACFNIERSVDGINFSLVEKVPGVNQNGSLTDYNFYDNSPLMGLSFYRLKQVDIDSNFNYSPIVRVKSSGSENTTDIFPNPAAGGFFKIDIFQIISGKIDIQIYDMNGRLQWQQQFNKSTICIQHHLPAGIYMIKITGKAFINTKRLVIE